MIAMFLFFVVVVSALALNSEALPGKTKPFPISPGEDGMVALPRPDEMPQTPRMASDREMKFAGQYLHLGGLALVALGLISRLRMSGSVQNAASTGLLPCLFGGLLGLGLAAVGYRMKAQGLRVQALALIATGTALLAAVLGAAHFKFAILPLAPLVLLTLGLVCWVGSVAVSLSSPALAGALVVALFTAPMAVGFSFPSAGVAIVYLLTINVGVTAVAYLKRWDAFLIAALMGSYALFLQAFGLGQPGMTLTFLVLTYGLFLISGNLFHFWKKSASDFHLGLSMVNPIMFGCVSYLALLRLPNGYALLLYSSIALMHIGLTWWATRISGQGPAYNEIARGNWGLALLFGTATISFVAHIDLSADNFGYVALLLLGQVYLLSLLSERLPAHLSDLARGGSYWALALCCVQMVGLVPFMEQPGLWRLLAGIGMLGYFLWQQDPQAGFQRKLASNLSLLCCFAIAVQSTPVLTEPTEVLLIAACLAACSILLYKAYPQTLAEYRYLTVALDLAVLFAAYLKGWIPGLPSLPLYLTIGLLVMQIPLCGDSEKLQPQKEIALLTGFALAFRAVSSFDYVPLIALGAALLLALLSRVYQGSQQRDALVTGVALAVATVALVMRCPSPVEIAFLLLIASTFSAMGLFCLNEPRWILSTVSLGAALALVLKASLALSSGAFATLVWASLGIICPRLARVSPRFGLPLLFAAFLKSILWDANFVVGKSGWNLTNQVDPSSVVFSVLTVGCFAAAARWSADDLEFKTYNTLFALLCLIFGVTRVLVHFYGSLEEFQILLSGFWACASALFVAFGINQEDKLFRLFGLALLVSSMSKILAIDLWMLSALDRTAPTFLLGVLMMAVSYLYQSNREKLVSVCPN